MKKKIILILTFMSLIISVIVYLNCNYIKVPYVGYAKLLKWDASVGNHKVDDTIIYQRQLNSSEISENQILDYIQREQQKSKLPQIISLPDKNTLKKNFRDHESISASTLGSSDFLQKNQYKITFQVKKINSYYVYTIYVENY